MRLALVDDDRQLQLLRQRHLQPKGVLLHVARDVLIMVIESDLANGLHARVPCELPIHQNTRLVHLIRVVRMAAHGGPDPVVPLRQPDGTFARRQVAANVHHAAHLILRHAGQNLFKILCKARLVEVCVGIKIHGSSPTIVPVVRAR